MTLHEDVLAEIQHLVARGLDHRDGVFDLVLEARPQELGITKDDYTAEDLGAHVSAALRGAIDDAFGARLEEMASWPDVTDCDRLRSAFDALEAQGIVCLENAGFTIQEGSAIVDALSLARDALAGPLGRLACGSCFFTRQDVMHAVDGQGICLAYTAYGSDPEPAEPTVPADVAAPPAKCPLCKGRGWIPPSDATQFPTTCTCGTSAAPPVIPAPPPNPGQKIGAAVVKACTDAGLTVEWGGSEKARVELPALRWQRRLAVSKDADIQDFLESWELEIRAGYTPASEVIQVLDERAGDWLGGFSDFGPALRERLRSHTERFLEQEQRLEQTWAEATVNDRIASAFEELRQQGVFASECLGMTLQDSWGYAGMQAAPEQRGVVFFHNEDVIDAVGGLGLLLAFGPVGPRASEAEDDDSATLALGRQVVSALERNGLACRWNESPAERIRVEPFEWRRRRWTKAPVYERGPLKRELPKPPSLLSRIFGKSSPPPPKPDAVRENVSALACGVIVRAVRDESGFNVRRAREMRAAWKALGNGGEAQAGHVWLPHVFLPPGKFTAMAPQLATANLRTERNELFVRGAESRSAQP